MNLEALHEIANIGRSLIRIAELFKEETLIQEESSVETLRTKEEEEAEVSVKLDEPVKVQEANSHPTCTEADLKKAFIALSEMEKDSEAIALLTKYGYSKLSQVNEKDYQSLKEEAEAIANA